MAGIPPDSFVPATGASDPAFYNAVRDAPQDPTIPELLEDTSTFVTDMLTANQAFAQQAVDDAQTTMHALSTASFPPELPDPPAAPSIVTSFTATVDLGFDATPDLGSLPTTIIDQFVATPIVLPDIDDQIPVYVPLITGLNIPDAPKLVLPPTPIEPGIDFTFVLPDAPAADYGAPPDLEPFDMPLYVAPVLPVFGDTAPTFDVLPPSPFINWTEPVYTSSVKDAVQAVISTLLAGGTGLPADVELAIWEREREREDAAGRSTVGDAIDEWTARGFSHPTGQLNAQVLAVREEIERKINTLARDVMIKQADMEQHNREFAVEKALSFEQIYVGIFLAVIERNFQIAKFTVDTQIQIYNMQVTAFNVEATIFTQKIALYHAQLDAVFAYLKAFEALVEAEKAKAEVNVARITVYAEKVKAYNAKVEGYKALVQAATARAELQKNKVDIFKAQIDAYVGQINGERAKFEAYDSQVKAETAKLTLEQTNAQVYETRVRAIGVVADIEIKEAQLQIDTNRQTLDWNIANMQRATANTGQYLSVIQARLAAFQAVTGRNLAKYEADRQAAGLNLQAQVSLSQVAISKYQALLEQWKTRSTEIVTFAQINAESLRAAGQMASNLASGAMASTHVSAGLSAGTSASQNTSRSTSSSSSQSKSVNETDSYSIAHNYSHRV